MKTYVFSALSSAFLVFFGVSGASAQGLSMQECSAKYNAARAANTLGGMNWNEFRRAQCGANAAPAASAPATSGAPQANAPAQRRPPATQAGVVFPTAIDSRFAAEKPHVQRMKTCSFQWQANKATGGNGDMRWIQQGGGYWPECNRRLKGQTGA